MQKIGKSYMSQLKTLANKMGKRKNLVAKIKNKTVKKVRGAALKNIMKSFGGSR